MTALSQRNRLAILAGGVIACAALDLGTKALAQAHLAHRSPIPLLGGFARLTYAENPGAFLSLGAGLPPAVRSGIFIGLVGVFMIFMLVVAARDRELTAVQTAVMGIIIGGGIGNLYDRVAFGVVRDFMVIGYGWLRTGIFNVGDMGITLGVIFLAWSMIADKRRRAAAGDAAPRD